MAIKKVDLCIRQLIMLLRVAMLQRSAHQQRMTQAACPDMESDLEIVVRYLDFFHPYSAIHPYGSPLTSLPYGKRSSDGATRQKRHRRCQIRVHYYIHVQRNGLAFYAAYRKKTTKVGELSRCTAISSTCCPSLSK